MNDKNLISPKASTMGRNNLVNRLYKSNNKKISSSYKPINLPHI